MRERESLRKEKKDFKKIEADRSRDGEREGDRELA